MIKKIIILSLLIYSILLPQTNSDALRREALDHMKFERYGEAIDLLNRYISANPRKTDGYTFRAFCYEKRGLYESAVYDLRTANKINSSDKSINENLSRVTETWYALLHNRIAGYKREIAIDPSIASNYLEIGKAYKNLGNWSEAEVWYDKYLTMEHASSDEILRYCEILAALNKISKGEPILKKYCELNPDDHRLWSRYGYFTLWLGKNKIAIDAFENSLKFRPYFKEALDGLAQANGKGFTYLVNDTTKRNYSTASNKGYAIDNYIRRLKNNPNDNATRILLIKELLHANRFNEAESELKELGKDKNFKKEFEQLGADLKLKKSTYYKNHISDLKEKYESNKEEKVLLKLTAAFVNMNDYSSAKKYYEDFLSAYPNSEAVRYQFAVHSGWFMDYCTAGEQIAILNSLFPENTDYKLLKLKYSIWTDQFSSDLITVINEIQDKQISNSEFEVIAANILVKLEKPDQAEHYIRLAEKNNPQDPQLELLKGHLENLRSKIEDRNLFSLLEEARTAAFHRNCIKAIDLYKKYLTAQPDELNILRELSSSYECDGNYNKAISIYTQILDKEFSFTDALQRAKLYLWSRDSVSALREFKKLYAENPDNNEVKLLLGDAYLANGLELNAKNIYSEMLLQNPGSYIIKKRMNWLSPDDDSNSNKFFTNLMLIPEANFFSDNISLRYKTQGIGLQVGLTKFIAAGISFYNGDLRSDSGDTDFNIIKGTVYLKLNRIVSATAGFGRTRFENEFNSNITEVSLRAEDEMKYTIIASFNSSDASHIMYSPFLVDERLNAKNYSLNAKYFATTNTFLAGRFMYNSLSDSNDGYHLDLKLGENFNNRISAGYVYSFIDYKNRSLLYWSPENFEAHSLWADWKFISNKETEAVIGGKVGIIPENDFILREISGSLSHKFFDKLTLRLRASAGSTVRQETGYSSVSFGISAFWSF
ncbi:MAG: tetratricopeptide repeat protein [Ignavibacteriales bacterium]|nr:MAG: tetratricopeptide repeat protein [Ignavibacteriales bacterium]